MLQLHSAAAPEVVRISVLGQARRIPEAHRCLHAEVGLKGRCARKPHRTACGAEEAVLRHHARDGHHGQPAIVELRVQGAFVLLRVSLAREDWHSKAAEARSVASDAALLLAHWEELEERNENADLSPTLSRHLVEGGHAVWDVRELEILGGRAEARPAEILRRDVANARKHGDAAVLDLGAASAEEGVLVSILGHAKWVEVLHGQGGPDLTLEGPARRNAWRSSLGSTAAAAQEGGCRSSNRQHGDGD
mmetsp:Transcript_35825/g.64750  ORF Transcript_35825/g.64750 Transcript_35825/m.64750 type:complete len:249 (+) Transcript_35825:589-1335(+)